MLNLLGKTPDHGFDEPIGLLTDCHRRIEMFLEVLARAAAEYADRPLDAQAIEAVTTARKYFLHAAPRHTADEEESLFPRVKVAAAAQNVAVDVIERLQHEHEEANELHERVDGLLEIWLRDGRLAPQQSSEIRGVLTTLRELYREHIQMEEREAFPLAAKVLSPSELSSVGVEMRRRRGLEG